MAKSSVAKGTSKVRLFYMEADLQEGEITQVAQMIQHALGGRGTVQRLNGPAARVLPAPVDDAPHEVDGAAEVIDAAEIDEASPAPAKPRRQRKIRNPNLDHSLHPDVEPTFKAYADARNISSGTNRLTKFLVVAAWLHEERNQTPITGDRAFTCFRFIKWPYGIDFDQPLRDLKLKRNFLDQSPEQKGKGEYSITHLGLDHVNKMKVGS